MKMKAADFLRRRASAFTMLELVVALGVFAILLMVLMQFFTSAQSAWTGSERRSRAYADSRAVFDLLTNALKSAPRDRITVASGTSAGGLDRYEIECPATFPSGYIGVFHMKVEEEDGVPTLKLREPKSSGSGIQSTDFVTVQPNVIEFTVVRRDSELNDISANPNNDNLAFVEVGMTLMGANDFVRYSDLSGADATRYLNENGFRFVRVIALPQ